MSNIQKVRHTLGLIREDCEQDTARLEGQTVSGRVIAEEFGKIRAAIYALSKIIDVVIDEMES